MCAPDNKNEMAKNLEILKIYLPLHGLHAGKGVANWCFDDPEIYKKKRPLK